MMKKLVKILVVIVVLLVVAAGALWFYIDSVAEKALTGGVRYAGGVDCTVDSVSISLLGGSAGIKTLKIMNPDGYPESEMFAIDSAKVGIQTSSLWNKPLRIRELEVIKPVVRIEAGRGGNNISVFLKHVKETVGAAEKDEKDAPARMIVDHLVLRDATIRIGSGVATGHVGDITLAEVELKDIRGKDGEGVTSGELAGEIVLEMVRRGVVNISDLKLDQLVPADVVKGVEDLRKSADEVIKGVEGIIKNPLDALRKPKDETPK